jgi:hypothetical protein
MGTLTSSTRSYSGKLNPLSVVDIEHILHVVIIQRDLIPAIAILIGVVGVKKMRPAAYSISSLWPIRSGKRRSK